MWVFAALILAGIRRRTINLLPPLKKHHGTRKSQIAFYSPTVDAVNENKSFLKAANIIKDGLKMASPLITVFIFQLVLALIQTAGAQTINDIVSWLSTRFLAILTMAALLPIQLAILRADHDLRQR